MRKSIFQNPEFKSVFFIFLTLYLLFAAILIAVIYQAGQHIETAIVQREAAIIGSLLQDHLEEENRVVSAFFQKQSAEDLLKGSMVLGRYGLTVDEVSLQHSRQYSSYRKFGLTILVLLTAGLLLFGGVLFYFGRRMSERLQVLARGADEIMDGNFQLHLPEEGEGDFALVGYQLNQMARRLQLSLEALEREKSLLKDLISNISHQLKTPLASLRTYNELLLEGAMEDPVVRKEFLETSQHQIERMEWLVQTMLKISRLEAGVIPIHRKPIALRITVGEVVASLKLRWQAKDQTVILSGTDSPCIYSHDRQWLGEALENVLKNAIDYTPAKGRIELLLDETEAMVRIIVRDTGVGIGEEELPHIFKQFYQGAQHGKGGSGVGLALARLVVEKHNGLIDVVSERNRGTTLTLTFPKWND